MDAPSKNNSLMMDGIGPKIDPCFPFLETQSMTSRIAVIPFIPTDKPHDAMTDTELSADLEEAKAEAPRAIGSLISLGEVFPREEEQALLSKIEKRLAAIFPPGTLRTTKVYALVLWFTKKMNMCLRVTDIHSEGPRGPKLRVVAIYPESLHAFTGDPRFHRDELKKSTSAHTRAIIFLHEKSDKHTWSSSKGKDKRQLRRVPSSSRGRGTKSRTSAYLKGYNVTGSMDLRLSPYFFSQHGCDCKVYLCKHSKYELDGLKCHCKKHSPTCGCLAPKCIKQMRINHFAALVQHGTDTEVYARRLTALGNYNALGYSYLERRNMLFSQGQEEMKEFVPKLALIEGKLNKLDTLERKLDWLTDKVKKPKSKMYELQRIQSFKDQVKRAKEEWCGEKGTLPGREIAAGSEVVDMIYRRQFS
uniref:Uncharacterized protein n=1 Tax=Branchiostoma floridae TaxID=7739 RepID=C3ZB01_BRAFL|eukprot:XP_002594027.1 hypothetical protein BRAFLDRAFT_68533 [Branchiostoma floridae]